MLKPGGQCFLWILADNLSYQVWGKLAKIPKWSTLVQTGKTLLPAYYGAKDYISRARCYLDQSPFVSFDIRLHDETFSFRDAHEYNGKIGKSCYWSLNKLIFFPEQVNTVSPFYNKLSPKEKEEYLADYLKIVSEMGLIDANGRVHNPLKIIVVSATKTWFGKRKYFVVSKVLYF